MRGFAGAPVGGSVGVAGPGSGFSEESMAGVNRSTARDCEDAPECPPGPASAAWASATSWR